ncbi:MULTISPECIES: hypothetical protein [unclassified Pseudomonas]|uniref:hypothetical protein n=1 Tax=unclassified Pseudomonas TaxID=196821 RepID=UPI00257E2115|nr:MULTISPECIES: hypothetical protein [unclassified Pseudomonas]
MTDLFPWGKPLTMSKARKVLLLLMIVGAALGYLGLRAASTPREAQAGTTDVAQRQQLIHALVSNKKSPIKEARWVTPSLLQIGVVDDHTLQFRLAESVCLSAKQYGTPARLVRVVDAAELRQGGKLVELGQAACQ